MMKSLCYDDLHDDIAQQVMEGCEKMMVCASLLPGDDNKHCQYGTETIYRLMFLWQEKADYLLSCWLLPNRPGLLGAIEACPGLYPGYLSTGLLLSAAGGSDRLKL